MVINLLIQHFTAYHIREKIREHRKVVRSLFKVYK